MLNVIDLELRHKNYKRKIYMPYVATFFTLIFIAISVVYILYYNSTHSTINTVITKPQTALSQSEKAEDNKTVHEVNYAEDEALKLSPSLEFINKMQSLTAQNHKNDLHNEYKAQKKPVEKNKAVKVLEKQTQNKGSVKIKRENEDDDIKHVIKRFNVNHNPALSLFIAKRYYKLGKFDQAYNYALITNGIDNNIDESWIVFAKSLVKLKKRDTAINILTQYINQTHSSQAQVLLDEIVSGKFK